MDLREFNEKTQVIKVNNQLGCNGTFSIRLFMKHGTKTN